MFTNLNKINNLQFKKAVIELLFDKITVEEYNRFDLNIQNSSVGFLIKSFF